MRLSASFTLAEMVKTQHRCDNTPTPKHIEHLRCVAVVLQALRDELGNPIVINSGYRSEELNGRVGGSSSSAHCHGLAVDYEIPGVPTIAAARMMHSHLVEWGMQWDQIILECYTPGDPDSGWVHFGLEQPGTEKQRCQLLTYDRLTYHEGLCP